MLDATAKRCAPEGYELLRPAARGPRTEVWKVCAKDTGLPFAWKRAMADSDAVRDALQREAELCRAAQTGVPKLHADLSRRDPPALLLEWLEGETLEQLLERETRLSVGHTFWLGRQIAQRIAELRRAGFAHGNLQPAHIFLEENGRVRFVGGGSAMRLDDPNSIPQPIVLPQNAAYRAPEAPAAAIANPVAADAYSLGVILYQSITGRLPFHGESVKELRRLHRQAKPPSVRAHCPYLPPAAEELIAALLSKQPLRRPHQPRELLQRLLDVELQTITFRRVA